MNLSMFGFNFAEWMLVRRTECVALAFALLLCAGVSSANAQQAPEQQSQPRDQMTRPPSSDLMKENLGKVAASGGQIKAVLVKDPGIMVELKTWVAKDAADHGQIVIDSELTDQAIFDRLIWDVQFRSIATRLLQRYGYLLPTVNPDSDLGKQQDLIMKERALQYAKSEEEARSNRNQGREDQTGLERAGTCDPQLDRDCEHGESAPAAGISNTKNPLTISRSRTATEWRAWQRKAGPAAAQASAELSARRDGSKQSSAHTNRSGCRGRAGFTRGTDCWRTAALLQRTRPERPFRLSGRARRNESIQ